MHRAWPMELVAILGCWLKAYFVQDLFHRDFVVKDVEVDASHDWVLIETTATFGPLRPKVELEISRLTSAGHLMRPRIPPHFDLSLIKQLLLQTPPVSCNSRKNGDVSYCSIGYIPGSPCVRCSGFCRASFQVQF